VRERACTIALVCAALVAAVGLTFTWHDLLATFALRPLDYAEAEVLFDASRIRAHLPLYVDVVLGAFYGNDVPSRHFVVYVPTHAWLLAHLPGGLVRAGRLVSVAAWAGAVAWRGALVLLYALLVFGTWGLSVYAFYARPDALALLAAGVAFSETMRRKRVGATFGALFALAFWIKPNCVGLFAGAMLAEVWVHRRQAARAIGGAAVVSACAIAVLQVASGGAWVTHLLASSVLPFSPSLWVDAAAHYVPFYAFPIAFAAWAAWRADGVGHGVLGLAVSTAWTLVTIGKIGAAGNYWMEPCLGALAVVASVPVPPLAPRGRAALAMGALVEALWIGVADVRTAIDEERAIPRRAAFLDHVRERCGAPAHLVLSDEPGTEMALDGRLLFAPMQLRELVGAGRFPVAPWLETVGSDAIACVVVHDDSLEESRVFPAAVTAALAARFNLAEAAEDMRLYVHRGL
jgi:hypothetical protein